jgi:hypothetical protein
MSKSSSSKSSSSKGAATPLDMTSADKTVWLVKLPQFVAQRLDKAEDGDVVGSLQLSAPAPGSSGPTVSVEVNYNGPTEEFHLTELPTGPQVVAFSSHQDKFKIKGKVSKTYNMNPKDTEEYRRVCRERRQLEAKTRETHALKMEDVQQQSNAPKEVDFIPPAYAEAKRNAAGAVGSNKRQRASTDAASKDIRNEILKAFSLRERLTLREITSVTHIAESQLKDNLKVYATYNTKGAFMSYWELKPEYKFTAATGLAAPGTATK